MRTLWPREFYRSILLHGHACSREDGSEEPGWEQEDAMSRDGVLGPNVGI